MSIYHDSDMHSTAPSTANTRKSSVARNQSLIKKNTGPHELRPSDILIERFQGWKHITKNLIAYFEGIADIENNTAKELTKLGGVIQVPFREGNQFLGEAGVQDIFYGVRDKTRIIADHHANLAKTVDSSIVQHLQKLRSEIKAHIKNIQNDTGKLASSVARERELSTKEISTLARSITMLKNTPMQVIAREDPWIANIIVQRQLSKQVQEENALQKSIIIMQQNSAHFEEGVVRSIQSAWSTFDEWSGKMSQSVTSTWAQLGVLMRTVQPDTEWNAFASRTEHLLDPDTPLRNPETIDYPGKDDPSVIPVHNGMLERKKRFTKSYKEGYYCLTPAGYLHEFRTSDPASQGLPILSLFLPECTLGAPSPANSRSHKFHVEGKKPPNMIASIGRDHEFTFRGRSHDEMMEWWNDAKQLSKVYLTSSEAIDRSGPVPAAVRMAGYRSEEESDEEGGSSVEDEDEDDEEEEEGAHDESAHANVTQGSASHDDVPAYSKGSESGRGPVDVNGYPVDKKLPNPEEGESKATEGEGESTGAGKEKLNADEAP